MRTLISNSLWESVFQIQGTHFLRLKKGTKNQWAELAVLSEGDIKPSLASQLQVLPDFPSADCSSTSFKAKIIFGVNDESAMNANKTNKTPRHPPTFPTTPCPTLIRRARPWAWPRTPLVCLDVWNCCPHPLPSKEAQLTPKPYVARGVREFLLYKVPMLQLHVVEQLP